MPDSPERDRPPTGVRTAEDFLRRLKEPVAVTVRSIVETVERLADEYNSQHEFLPGSESHGFFGLYGIGGNITKEGERPDVDLLIATNARWQSGYRGLYRRSSQDWDNPIILSRDWIAGTLLDTYEKKGWKVELLTKIPSEYDGKGVSPKAMIRLTPNSPQTQGRIPIDIVYVRTDFIKGVRSLSDFKEVDVDEDGNALPRVTLLEKENLGKMLQLRF